MPATVGYGLKNKRSHHIKLTSIDGANEVGFICVGPDGKAQPDIQVRPYPGTASQIKSGRSKYADKIPPFLDVPLHDFSGGMGMLHHDEDESRYMYGYQVDTSKSARSMLAGRATYTKGIRDFSEYQPAIDTLMAWSTVSGDVEQTFTVGANTYDADKALTFLRKVGSPTGDVTFTLLTAGDSVLETVTYSANSLPAYSPYGVWFDWTGTRSLAATTSFKIKINYSGGDSDNYVQLWYDSVNSKFPFRVLDDTAGFSTIFFEYRGGFYCVTQPDDRSNSSIYMLGYRGLADSNSGDRTKLNDATASWTVDGLIGYEVRIVGGPGSDERQSWRVITDNDGTSLTVATFNINHTTDTEYVIIDDTWRKVEDLDFYCTDAVVADRVLWLAGGSQDYLHRMRWGNNDQTWTWEGEIGVSEDAEAFRASKLVAIAHTNPHGRRKTFDLYTARNDQYDGDRIYPNTVTRYMTPPFYGSPYVVVGQMTDHRAWVAEEITHVVQSADKRWARFDVSASFVTGTIATKDMNPVMDVSDAEAFLVAVSTSVNMSAGDLQLVLLDAKDNSITLDFPAVVAEDDLNDLFKWVQIDLHAEDTAPTHGYIDLSRIKRIQLSLATDLGAQIIKLGKSGIWAMTRSGPAGQFALDFNERVNGLVEYGGGGGQVIRRPWVGTTKNIYYIEGSHLLPIYLSEIEELEHERNCELMGVNDVYLYFNLGKKLQRYYAGQLDNIGPEVDYSLPESRAGYPCTFASYPGRTFVGWDSESSGTSWVGFRRAHGWHESYRSLETGARIRSIHSLARLSTTDQLFVSEGADILYLPLAHDSEQEPDFPYAYHGHVESSRIYGSTMRETEKYFHDFETIMEYHDETTSSDTEVALRVYYRTNNQSDYTLIGDFTDFPNHERKIGTNNVSGNWIQFLIEYETGKAKYSPILTAGILGALERTKVKNSYKYRVMIKEGKDKTLAGTVDDLTGIQKYNQLDTWINQPLPLTLGSNSQFEDGKIVMLEPKPARLVSNELVAGREQRVYDITLIEVE